AGAIAVYESTPCVELVPAYSARAFSAGILSRDGWAKLSAELLAHVRERAAVRKIVGERVPIVISLDLHGIVTAQMLRHVDGLAIYHTYPHVDFADTGSRAARLMLKILGGAKPVIARVTVPALVRGDELITETGVYGAVIQRCQ